MNLSNLALLKQGDNSQADVTLHHFFPKSFNVLQPLRQWLNTIQVNNPQLAHHLCKLIPECASRHRVCGVIQGKSVGVDLGGWRLSGVGFHAYRSRNALLDCPSSATVRTRQGLYADCSTMESGAHFRLVQLLSTIE